MTGLSSALSRPEEAARPATLAAHIARTIARHLAAVILAVEVIACLLAPVYAHDVAHRGPNAGNLSGTVRIHGKTVPVVSQASASFSSSGAVRIHAGSQPIGPQWFSAGGRYVLGADEQGRDVAVRFLYGGRLSLFISIVAAAICITAALVLALLAGYFGGWVDAFIGRALDVIWSLPWILMSIAIGAAFSVEGFNHFGIHIRTGDPALLILMLSYGPLPYYARALRAQVLTLRTSNFVRAAEISGASRRRIIFGELLPNVTALVPSMFALDVANVLLAEATLTFLGVGIQPPTASWGSLIADGQSQLSTAPWLTYIPSIGIVLTAMCIHVVGEQFRGARNARAVTTL